MYHPGPMSFPETRYSVVEVLRTGSGLERERALSLLASTYRGPIQMYLQRQLRGDSSRAEELTQAFFVAALERNIFGAYLPDRARFRTFVRVCVDRFADNAARDASRLKRGGGARAIPIHDEATEGGLQIASDTEPADAVFEQEFKRSLLQTSIDRLRERLIETKREHYFHVFRRFDLHDGSTERPSYAQIAVEIGSTATQVTNHLHAARKEFRRVVAATLRELSASEREYLEEAQALGIDPSPP